MNSSLDHDFEEFKFSAQNKLCENDTTELLENFGMFLGSNN